MPTLVWAYLLVHGRINHFPIQRITPLSQPIIVLKRESHPGGMPDRLSSRGKGRVDGAYLSGMDRLLITFSPSSPCIECEFKSKTQMQPTISKATSGKEGEGQKTGGKKGRREQGIGILYRQSPACGLLRIPSAAPRGLCSLHRPVCVS